MRYIEAERVEPDFITKGLSTQFMKEIFLYFYFAGNGCSDHTSRIMLNEKNIEDIFWGVEFNIKRLL